MEHYYELISEDRVDPEKIQNARKIIDRYRKHLEKGGADLPEFKLRWFRSAQKEAFEIDRLLRKLSGSREEKYLPEKADIGGVCSIKPLSGKKIIYLREDQSINKLGKALIHELSHVYRSSYHGPFAVQILEDLARLDEESLAGLLD